MELTDNQRKAIEIRDANVLVSAAAGSGKTSVLVERIVRRITDANDPVDVDRLLIMTFTNAAAAEMRDRIREAIDTRIFDAKKEKASPEYVSNLEKQSILVNNAMITTIHGFCKNVITDHFEEVSIDPGFRVADDSECRLIRQDALDECVEAAYEKADPAFLQAVEAFSDAKSDAGFTKLLIPLYEYVMANPEPEEFIKEGLFNYGSDSFEDFKNSGFMITFETLIKKEFEKIRAQVKKALALIDEYEKLSPYRATIEAYDVALGMADKEISAGDGNVYDPIRRHLLNIEVPSLGRILEKKLDESEKIAKDEVKRLRDSVKSAVSTLSDKLEFELETAYGHIIAAKPHLEALTDAVLDFSRIYEEKKRDKNVIDFNDMEHLAVRILKDPKTAEVYRRHFIEIYIDEYQDSNMTQEKLVSLICRHDPPNVFQVGDVKQSIYRFRQARPDLFLRKYNEYSDDEGSTDRRIILNDNFRSRRQVVDAVNEIFSGIMKADLGGIEYDERAALTYGATCFENDIPCDDMTYNAELVIGVRDELGPDELTANIIADRIVSMVRSGYLIYDKGRKVTRPLSFGDITILVRSIKKYEPVFREVFSSVGIPLAVTGKEGYFGTLEVRTSLAFLSAVDNPFCDIPLATLARCPVCGFTDKDLAMVTAAAGNKKCLYERIRAAAEESAGNGEENGIPAELGKKCRDILELIGKYKEMSTYMPVSKILADFIDSRYADHVRCMSKGPQRMANLEMLLSKAEEFGKTSFKGLYRFVQYMDLTRRYQIDDGEARLASENDDVVRIMTMHASKGLEFPVCFLAGMEKRRNTLDESGRLIWNVKMGFGTDHTDVKRRISVPTLPKMLVKEINKTDSIAEEMRILYVAMTRAREKLIMVGCGKENVFEKAGGSIEESSSYLDMIKAAAGENGYRHIDVSFVTESDIVGERFAEEIKTESASDEILSVVRECENKENDDRHTRADLPEYMNRLGKKYPYPVDPDLKAKLSVSELKHKAVEEMMEKQSDNAPEGERLFAGTEPEKYIPKFMRSEGENATGGTFYGTAFHRVLELWDYTHVQNEVIEPEQVTEFVEEMYRLHRMDLDQINAVRPGDIAFFLNSTLGRRMKKAKENGCLFREQPFVIGVRRSDETVLVQGIIDAYFMEDGAITIVDYKTDNVSDENVLKDRYRTQLEYYAKALSQITEMPVKELMIYSSRLRSAIDIS